MRFLFLNNNRLTTLPENLFSKITSLEQLLLNNNRLRNLPPGVFRGLSTPTLLWIHANAVNPIPLTISLEKVGETQFKVTVPAGAPFDIDLSLTVTNGSITGGINSTTITAGSVESDPFTVTRTPGVLDAVTVDIGTLPGLPTNHLGYNLVKLNDPPLVVIRGVNRAPVFTEGASTTRSVAENTAANVHIGTAVVATDVDNDTLTYTRGGTDAASYEIDSATGQLKTKVTLDYETKNTYSVTITVSDGSLTDTINVTINVTDIDETIPNRAPVFTEGGSTARIVAENTDAGVNFGAAVAATDPDGNTLAYTIGGTDATAFEINGAMGQLNTKAELDYETKNAYSVTITVSDGSLTDTINVNINVNDANDAPVFTEGDATTRTVAENAAAGIHIGTPIIATDADGNILTYTLGGTDVAFFEVDNTIGQLKTKTILDYESQSSYKITVIVSDGSLSDTIDVTITVTDIDETTSNRAPIFTEGENTTRTVEENTEAGANIGTAIAATDPDGNTLTYTLGGTDAASFVIEVATGQLKTKETLDYETKNSYSITVTVSDGSLTDTIAGTINITDANEVPVFTEGNATTRSVAENLEVGVNIGTAIAATDPDGNTLTYTLGGPDAASFDVDSSTGQLKTKTTLDRESQSTYTVTITVSDGSITNIIVVTINVSNVNEVPVFTEGNSTTRTVAEKTLEGVEIGTAIGATDPDGDTLTYTLSGTDADIFELESTTGQLKTKKILDFETQFTYKVTLTVSDGKLSDTIDVTITVIDIDETIPNRAPVFTDGENTTRSVAENTSADTDIGTAIAATDPDGNTLIYTLSGTDAATFDIDSTSGQLKTKDTLDYETKNTCSVTITVSDGSLTDTINVTINVTDIVETIPNRAPVFTEGETTTRAVAENTIADTNIGAAVAATDPDGNTLTYTLGGTDAATFDIDSTSGQLKTKDTLNYENKSSYSVTITVSDGDLTDVINVNINVTNQNDAPIFTKGNSATRAVAENTAADTNIGAAVAATDPDGNTLTYTLGGTDAATFDIDSTSGQLKTKDTLNYEDKSSYSVTITVSDGSLTDMISVTINVTDVNENRAPVFTDGENTTRTVAENTAADTNIGIAVAATDADNDTLTYTLSGTDAISFAIENTTGHLKTKATLNYETKSSYLVTVSVSDDNGGSDSISVTITVTDITQTTFTAVCDRTPEVRDALVTLAGVSSCNDVTEEHLAGITYFSLHNLSITSLKTGDFDGLSSLTTLVLTTNTKLTGLEVF